MALLKMQLKSYGKHLFRSQIMHLIERIVLDMDCCHFGLHT